MGHPKSSEASSTSFLNSETADTKTLVEQPRMSNMRHRYLDSWRIVFCSVAAFSLNTLALILNLTLVNNKKYHVFPPAVIGMVAGTLALVSVALDIVFIRSDDKSPNKEEEEGKKGFFKSMGIMRWPSIRPAIRQAITFLAFVPVIVTMVMLTLQAIDGQGNKFYAYLNTVKAMPRLSLVIVDCLALVSDLVLCAAMARLVWWPVHRAARSSMIISSLLQIAIATILIAINWQPFVGCILKPSIYITATFNLHQHVGAILFTTAMFSFLMCCALREGDRINKVFTRFINIYTVLAGICVVMLFGILGLAIHLLLDKTMKSLIQSATLTSDPILSGCAIFLFMVNFWAANYLQEPPPSSLAVEPIDLADLTSTQRRALAKMIDRHGRAMPDDPTGEAAISLMQAYCAATSLPNMRCMVLRVYKPSKVVDKSVMLNQMVANYSYEDDWAWRGLDLEQAVMKRTIPAEEVPLTPIVPKLSKAQQKKLQKKREEAAAKGMPISPMLSPEQIQAELEFRTKLESTEALVMMTQITDYDLTGSVKGIAGKILRRTLGAESPFKFLCVRLGLLAFHWPFRSSTFYTAHAKRPVARSAAVLRAIAEWNAAQPSTERCTVLLDPTYEHGDIDRAIHSSGWQSTPLPASHVIDLRAYKNKSIGEYLKAIKYRDQEANFKKANGEVIESTEFTPQECSEAMRLWHKIAEKRTSDGETAVLATPDEEMLMQLGASNHSASSTNAGAPGDRSLMFLRVDGVNVASCVLFRLGDTITSDLQGLDHDLARPLKAYFVMMQHVIAIALKEGKSFVDFGPTTAKPKMDIGCKSIGLNGAMYATSPLIRFAIGIAAENTRNALANATEAKE